jgi:hypothetical protein
MTGSEELAALKAQVERLTLQVALLEDAQAVRALHHKYGYYLDACLYEEIVELFAEGCELRFLNGIYRGKAGVRRLYCDWLRELWTGGREGLRPGLLYDHLMVQDVIDVAPDRSSAKGRFRSFMQGGFHESVPTPAGAPRSVWEGGIYENQYVREDGVWKIGLFDYSMLWQADYESGWTGSATHLMPLTHTWPDDPRGPDELTAMTPVAWPERRTVAFHYPHPVTGKVWQGADA